MVPGRRQKLEGGYCSVKRKVKVERWLGSEVHATKILSGLPSHLIGFI